MKALEEEEEEPEPAEILLYPGVQMMGRGCGNVLSKAVSRQQFTLTVVKDKVRMKALRDGPGYMKDGVGRFEPLKMGKAVVLTVGDKVVFRMREGKQGGHLGVHTILEEGGEAARDRNDKMFGDYAETKEEMDAAAKAAADKAEGK